MKEKKSKKQDKEEVKVISPNFESENNDYKNQMEALLFASGRPLEAEFIASVIGVADKAKIKKALIELKKDYDNNKSSLMVVDEGDFWKITVREKYLPIVRKIVADTELSKSVMETLAVIAWKSPALQSDVIKIRTNKAYDHIEALLDTGFITKEKKGRSFILKVANKFHEYFDVEGKEGIRKIFSKIKEQPVQKKVDEFKEKPQETLDGLKVVSSKKDDTVKEAEEDMEKRKLGRFEVYGEDQKEEDNTGEEQVKNNAPNNSIDVNIKEDKEKWYDNDEEKLKIKTKNIVKELLEEDKKPKDGKDSNKK